VPQSAVSMGVRWATRVTSVGLEFALPPLLGGFLDRRWGLGSTLTIAGAIFGFVAGMVHLLAIAREVAAEAAPGPRRPETGPTPRGPADESNERIGMG